MAEQPFCEALAWLATHTLQAAPGGQLSEVELQEAAAAYATASGQRGRAKDLAM